MDQGKLGRYVDEDHEHHYRRIPLAARRVPIRNGKHTYTHSGLGIVKIETDEHITGIGLGGTGLVGQATIEGLKHELIGEDPIDVERLWHKMWVPKIIGRRGLTTRAISAIDIGLWDIRAKWARLPLYKLLGGFRDRMPTYIAGGYYEESIPIATGENEYTRYGFRDLIEHNAAAISNGLILEFYRDSVDPMLGKIYHHTLRVNADGTVSPPDVPGHGAEPNYAELEPFRVGRDRIGVEV